jgi:hypothetical protein
MRQFSKILKHRLKWLFSKHLKSVLNGTQKKDRVILERKGMVR